MSGWSSRPSAAAAAGLALLLAGCLESPPNEGDDDGPVCGTTRVLAEAFDAESPEWQRTGESELAVGRVLLYAAPGGAASMYSTWEYQLAGSELTMQLRRGGIDEGRFAMQLVNRENDAVGLELTDEDLALFQSVGGSFISPHRVTFAPDLLWWRLREADGELFWSTSTDGSTWVERGSLALELEGPVGVLIELEAASAQEAAEIEAIVPSAAESLCAADSLTDEFTSETRDWYPNSEVPGCAVSGDQGALRIGHDAGERCGIESAEHFDLTGSAFAVEVVEVGDCDLSAWLTVLLRGLYPEIGCFDPGTGPMLVAQMFGDGGPGQLAMTPFLPELHRFWRIRHDAAGGELVFETGDAEGTWSELVTVPIEDDLVRGAGVAIQASDDSPDGTSDPVVFDRFNLVP